MDKVGLSRWIVDSCSAMGVTEPTDIQKACIPAILSMEDVLGLAETGSGKTAAFALPMLQQLFEEPYGVFGLVLSPARELAMQLAEQFSALGAPQKIRVTTLIGGLDSTEQSLDLQRSRPHVVVATPGRLCDHLQQLTPYMMRLHTLVLDEADRLLAPCFAAPVGRALATIKSCRKKTLPPYQTLLFSATRTPALDRLVEVRERPMRVIDLSTPSVVPPNLKQEYLFVPARVKVTYFVQLLKSLRVFEKERRAMIFVQTCRTCHELDALLSEMKVPAISLHSKLGQKRRLASLGKFKSQIAQVIVCTDVASRGLDIPKVDVVVNFDVPRDPDDYVHRVGRSGRAGKPGKAVTLVTQHDLDLLKAIEERISTKLTECDTVEENDVLNILNPVARAMASSKIKRPFEDNLSSSKKRKL